jgi:hypothetical protein
MKAIFITRTAESDYIVQMDDEAYFKCFGQTVSTGRPLDIRPEVITAANNNNELRDLKRALQVLKAA